MPRYAPEEDTRLLLKNCYRQYRQYSKVQTILKNNLISLLDTVFPNVNRLFSSPARADGSEKWVDFVAEFWHCRCVSEKSEKVFTNKYQRWCRKHGYNFSEEKAHTIPLTFTVLCTVTKEVGFMPKRRANGEGNIRKRKDGRWEGRYTIGHDPETGKAIIKNVLGKTQAEVKEKLKTAIEENVGIDYGKAKRFTVGSWLEVWMENYAKIKLRPSTFKTSQGFLKNHIKPQIGSIPLAELTSLDLQKFYKHLLEGGRVDRIEAKKKPKGLAPKTVQNIHQMICSAYNLAMEQKLVNKNPTQGCALPKVEHKEMKTLTADQLSAFFREARDSGVYELYYLDLATGLRRGELLGLKWSDVDFDRGVLKIQRAISRQNGRVEEAPLKTKNAYRTLPLSADAIDVLKMQKCKVGGSEWVFPSPTGGPMSPDSVLHMLQRVLKRAGLPRIRFHDLRHTFATMALQNGVDVKTVSSMLGHYSAGFTLDTYAHVTTDAQLKAAQTMGNILSRAV